MRSPRAVTKIAAVLLLGLTPLMAGCKAPGDLDRTSAPVILVISSITPAGDNFGDVVNDDGTVNDDEVEVAFVARLKASSDITAPELQEIIVERYEVTYRRTDGGTSTPAGMQRAMTAKVPITPNGSGADRTLTVTLTLTPGSQKLEPPLSHLISPGFDPDTGNTSIQTDATLTFYGKTIAGDRVTVSGGIGIQFANYAGS